MLRCLSPFCAAACVLATAACASSSSSPTTPASTPPTITETFTGTIAQTQSATYPFTVSATGSVQISLTSVAPLATMALGVGVTTGGTPCGTTNTVQNTDARAGATALGGIMVAGQYCVAVFDPGNIPDSSSATFTVQVVHP